jgi:TPR repeat protein
MPKARSSRTSATSALRTRRATRIVWLPSDSLLECHHCTSEDEWAVWPPLPLNDVQCNDGQGKAPCLEGHVAPDYRGAEHGYILLADIYESGNGVERSPAKATALFGRGCELGSGQACNNYGVALVNGTGVSRDERAGIEAWRRGCDLGAGIACLNIGGRYADGRAVARNDVKAREYLEQGCKLDDPGSCNRLGELDERGVNGKRAPGRARVAFARACSLMRARQSGRLSEREQRLHERLGRCPRSEARRPLSFPRL